MPRNFICIFRLFFIVAFLAAFVFVIDGAWAASRLDVQMAAVEKKKPSELVLGFRSARFGMNRSQVIGAIAKDFGVKKNDIEVQTNPVERTINFLISVKDLIADSGPAKVIYIFGYKSKVLVQVNVLWGWPIDPNPSPQTIVSTANILRKHFAEKGFEKEGLLMNVPVNQGSVIVFRGVDQAGQMVLLQLNSLTPSVKEEGNKNTQNTDPSAQQRITLQLSYITNPDNPDVFRLKPDEF